LNCKSGAPKDHLSATRPVLAGLQVTIRTHSTEAQRRDLELLSAMQNMENQPPNYIYDNNSIKMSILLLR